MSFHNIIDSDCTETTIMVENNQQLQTYTCNT